VSKLQNNFIKNGRDRVKSTAHKSNKVEQKQNIYNIFIMICGHCSASDEVGMRGAEEEAATREEPSAISISQSVLYGSARKSVSSTGGVPLVVKQCVCAAPSAVNEMRPKEEAAATRAP